MKNLKEYLIESHSFLVNKKPNNRQDKYEYYPKDKYELIKIIKDLLKKGITDLNCIDVSEITKMDWLFNTIISDGIKIKDIDISDWDVSNVTSMENMFCSCYEFNDDLSKWDVSNVINMRSMFDGCRTLVKNNKLPDWYKR